MLEIRISRVETLHCIHLDTNLVRGMFFKWGKVPVIDVDFSRGHILSSVYFEKFCVFLLALKVRVLSFLYLQYLKIEKSLNPCGLVHIHRTKGRTEIIREVFYCKFSEV